MAINFNGTTSRGEVNNWTPDSNEVITITYRFTPQSAITAGQFILELSDNYNNNDDTFLFNYNGTAGPDQISFGIHGVTSKYRVERYTRPATLVSHSVAVTLDNSTLDGDVIYWLDGIEQVPGSIDPNNKGTTGPFASTELNICCRNFDSPSNFFAGVFSELAIYAGPFVVDDAAALAAGATARMVKPQYLLNYWPMVDNGVDLIRGMDMTLADTSIVAHPFVFHPVSPMIGHNSGGAPPITPSNTILNQRRYGALNP